MGEQISVKFESKQVQRFLKGIINGNEKVAKYKKDYVVLTSAIVFQDIMEHYDDNMGSTGPWPKWTKRYASHMQRQGKGGNKLLRDSGKLRGGLFPIEHGKNSKVSSAGILWMNKVPYAAIHNYGADKYDNPKQREFMWLSSKGLDKIAEQTLQFLLWKR